ncbi:EthD family reductase [Mucilaginibacter ginkgonis]|uniref:EthD family reductase n=1 Tax=Mucilaginibacter ginkgonis TaxID=2682091 RepID=A0A7T7JFX5_9SPHI|nr:EthD family reductase [Mucilaginibacter ginkgonis]QQL48970.1 EthD family reductase [Mucilaginibacter ginkgonis]
MKKNSLTLLAGIMFLLAVVSAKAQSSLPPSIKKGTIKVTILYPNGEGKKFDMEYYTQKHFPMLRSLFGSALKATAIDKGLTAGSPGTPLPFLAIGYLYFDSAAAFQDGMKTYATKIRADVPNYTNITPIIQISEVVE